MQVLKIRQDVHILNSAKTIGLTRSKSTENFYLLRQTEAYVAVSSQKRNAVVFQSKFEFARQVKKA